MNSCDCTDARAHARVALALSGGAARGLAHIGVVEVFEREGIQIHGIAGSSMGGLIGALAASGLPAREMAELARSFYFPRWFLPGGFVEWDSIFASAVPALEDRSFEDLRLPLALTAVDLEAGSQVVLYSGPLLPAVRATCTVPGVLPAVNLDGRWLVDGGLVNILPVDVAWMLDPDIVVAVKVGSARARRVPQLDWRITSILRRLGLTIPNPASAKLAFEVIVRAVEIVLDRQTALAAAMAGPELLIEPELGDIGLRDFERIDEAVQAGRRAAEAALPDLLRLIDSPPRFQRRCERTLRLHFDPVCAMVTNPARARATAAHGDTTYYFCSENCHDRFVQDPEAYLSKAALVFGRKR